MATKLLTTVDINLDAARCSKGHLFTALVIQCGECFQAREDLDTEANEGTVIPFPLDSKLAVDLLQKSYEQQSQKAVQG